MAKLVSKTYGGALFDLAVEEGQLDVVEEEVRLLLATCDENEDFIKLLNHPKITREEKVKVVETVFKDRLSQTMTGFLVLVVEKGRNDELESILKYFLERVREYKNIGVAKVTSAVPLSEEQKKSVEQRLLETTKYVSFEMDYAVDESLIGGLVIRIGDRVVDSSIRTRIDRMAKTLMNS